MAVSVRCGLCRHVIEGSWEEHLTSEEHQANLKDDEKMRNARLQNFLTEQEAINETYRRR